MRKQQKMDEAKLPLKGKVEIATTYFVVEESRQKQSHDQQKLSDYYEGSRTFYQPDYGSSQEDRFQ